MAVSGRSDFLLIHNFPEVYHGQGITTPPISGAGRPVTGEGINTTYRINGSCQSVIYCVSWPLHAGRAEEDPELPFFGSDREKREERIGKAYPYACHLHMLYLYICLTSAYTEHIHTPGAMNLIPDMHHIPILTREKNHENRIDI